jgi:hypothetical protein
MHIWKILCTFGTFCVVLVPFSGFGITNEEKSGNHEFCSGMRSPSGNAALAEEFLIKNGNFAKCSPTKYQI